MNARRAAQLGLAGQHRANWHGLAPLLFAVACRPAPAVLPHDRAAAPAVTLSHSEASQAAAPEGALPNRLAVAGSTRGTVACGASRCAVPGEICVLLDAPRSAPAPAWQCLPSGHVVDGEPRYACDDASDCTGGQACCLGFESAFVAYACSARSGPRANCALESCVAGAGAPCPAGQVCSAGACVPADARATCNGGQRCPASAPICLWAKGVATCVATVAAVDTAELLPDELHMSCASNEDCGGALRCCSSALGNATSCRVNCDAANNLQLCQHDVDCLAASSAKRYCLRAEDPGHFPPWVRTCTVR